MVARLIGAVLAVVVALTVGSMILTTGAKVQQALSDATQSQLSQILNDK